MPSMAGRMTTDGSRGSSPRMTVAVCSTAPAPAIASVQPRSSRRSAIDQLEAVVGALPELGGNRGADRGLLVERAHRAADAVAGPEGLDDGPLADKAGRAGDEDEWSWSWSSLGWCWAIACEDRHVIGLGAPWTNALPRSLPRSDAMSWRHVAAAMLGRRLRHSCSRLTSPRSRNHMPTPRSIGIVRVSGMAISGGSERAWSTVTKLIDLAVPNVLGTPVDPRNEVLVYERGLLCRRRRPHAPCAMPPHLPTDSEHSRSFGSKT